MNILDLFYNEILKEAAHGRVDCNMMYNVLFETTVEGRKIYKTDEQTKQTNSLYITTLEIKNIEEFNQVLLEYYQKAKKFYKGKIDEEDDFDKTILTLLWNNATEEDFKNPVEYIRKYISFLDKPLELSETYEKIGYSEILDSDIEVCLKEEPINEETPYGIYIRSTKDNVYYDFPIVRLGIYDKKAYIYAVQQDKVKKEETDVNYDYQKKIHRKLFKVNDGFEKEEEIDNIQNPENLTGISPSALLSLSVCFSLLEDKNIDRIVVPTFLPVRYNGKEISFLVRKRLLQGKGYDIEKINDQFHELTEKHEQIQRNLSDKLLRNIRRLEYAFNNINVTSYPYELDSNTSISLTKYNDCNNKLLKEIYELTKAKQKTR